MLNSTLELSGKHRRAAWKLLVVVAVYIIHIAIIVNGTQTIINVYSTEDNTAEVISDCYPSFNSTWNSNCTFRSAWGACTELTSKCIVNLPENQNIAINVDNGQVTLTERSNIEIHGHGSSISRTGEAKGGIEAEDTGGDFPLSVNVSNTDFARVNFDEGCINACRGDTIRFTVCDNGDTSIDTSFRLFQGTTEVAENEDSCNFGAEITYAVPLDDPSECSDFCLHAGCWGNSACADTVVAYKTPYVSPRLLLYEGNKTSTNNVIPALALYNTSIAGFGIETLVGGAIYIAGHVDLTIQDTEFVSNVGKSGAALYMTNNTLGSLQVTRSTFRNVSAGSSSSSNITSTGAHLTADQTLSMDGAGGAVFVGLSVNNVSFVDNVYEDCRASIGGALFFGSFNPEVQIVRDVFSDCTAYAGGGAIFLNEHNYNMSIDNVTVVNTASWGDGGGIFVRGYNDRMRIRNLNISSCSAGSDGGGIYMYRYNSDITLESMHVQGSSARYGGAVYMDAYNQNIQLVDTNVTETWVQSGGVLYMRTENNKTQIRGGFFSECVATSAGGVMYASTNNTLANVSECDIRDVRSTLAGGVVYLESGNQDFLLQRNTFLRCTVEAGHGGVVYAKEGNHYLTVQDCSTDECATAFGNGGVLALQQGNHFLRISGLKTYNSSAQYGGVFYFNESNNYAEIAQSEFHNCNASVSGGAGYLDRANLALTMDDVAVTSSEAYLYGGGLYARAENHNLKISGAVFDATTSLSGGGGGVALGTGNTNFLMLDCQFSSAWAATGGALYLESGNNNATVLSTQVSNCSAGQSGGGIWLAANTNVFFRAVTVTECTALLGGGVYLSDWNINVQFSGVEIQRCSAGEDGGGMYLDDNNLGVLFLLSSIDSCAASARGGGLFMDSGNNGMMIGNSSILNCSAAYGGGLLSVSTTIFGVNYSTIAYNNATYYGGGVALTEDNVGTLFLEDSFHHNSAGTLGGALFTGPTGDTLVVAGSTFTHNTAGKNGGAMFVESGNLNFLVTDSASFSESFWIETEHPYRYVEGVTIFNRTISAPGVVEYMMHCGLDSAFAPQDKITIYNGAGAVVLEAFGGDPLPGIELPSLRIQGDSFTVIVTGFADALTPATSYQDDIYGLRLYITPVIPNPAIPTRFFHNTAGLRGGGLYMFGGIEFAKILSSEFMYNTASTGGGALYIRNAMTGIIVQSVVFVENSSPVQGGAVILSSSTYGAEFKNVTFVNNTAGELGGAVSMNTNNGFEGAFTDGNEIVFEGCVMTHNSAELGGAAFLDNSNAIVLRDSYLAHNTASRNGGGVFMKTSNVLYIDNSSLVHNTATTCGGGVGVEIEGAIHSSDANIFFNQATEFGGAFCLQSQVVTSWNGTNILQGNTARVLGGAIGMDASPLWTMHSNSASVLFANNAAQRGSAVYLARVDTSSTATAASTTLRNLQFVRNNASIGGTVYWLYDDSMPEEPAGLSDPASNILWEGNIAPYGNRSATQVVAMHGPTQCATTSKTSSNPSGLLCPSLYNVSVYERYLDPPPTFQVSDWYGSLLPLDGPTTFGVSVYQGSQEQCFDRAPFLTGPNLGANGVLMSNGEAIFDGLEAFCYPGRRIQLQFEARLNDLVEVPVVLGVPISNYYVQQVYSVDFRECEQGEYLIDNQECSPCPYGTYSLEYPVTPATTCIDCTADEGIESCSGNTIVLRDGYWRRFPDNVYIFECPLGAPSCAGRNATGLGICQEGYTGDLCSACAEDHFFAIDECRACSTKNSEFAPDIWAFIFIGVAGFLGYAAVQVGKMFPPDEDDSSDNGSDGGGSKSLYTMIVKYIRRHFKGLMIRFKLIITTFQIISSIPAVTQAAFPSGFEGFVRFIAVVDLNFASAIPVGCYLEEYDFMSRLLFATWTPVFFVLVLVVLFRFEYISSAVVLRKTDPRRDSKLKKIVNKYLDLFFVVTYLVLPSVTFTIFQTFLCTNVDPDSEDDAEVDWYLGVDTTISCDSTYYNNGFYYAMAMVLVYPLGIPLLYFLLLYPHRVAIATRDETAPAPGWLADQLKAAPVAEPTLYQVLTRERSRIHAKLHAKNIPMEFRPPPVKPVIDRLSHYSHKHYTHLSNEVMRLQFLWQDYAPAYWYWEIIETTRRLIMTAVLSVVMQGTTTQAIIGTLVALVYIKVYHNFQPYDNYNDDLIAELGQLQIFVTYLCALIYQKSLLSDKYDVIVSLVLICLNLGVLMLFLFFELRTIIAEKMAKWQLETLKQQELEEEEKDDDDFDDDDEDEDDDDDDVHVGGSSKKGSKSDFFFFLPSAIMTSINSWGGSSSKKNTSTSKDNNDDDSNDKDQHLRPTADEGSTLSGEFEMPAAGAGGAGAVSSKHHDRGGKHGASGEDLNAIVRTSSSFLPEGEDADGGEGGGINREEEEEEKKNDFMDLFGDTSGATGAGGAGPRGGKVKKHIRRTKVVGKK